ncbi:hypothetical protein SGFS_014680 [Streptomyces graminofaciens]|uniref:Uncharacterized protein n=1 Tax=Streptomyces graminofaciens TaxID=68212 RepID=A0ABM8HKK6_9ACTN|nr:hypothetical protein [Streptomyces graminofaciens]BBC30174.1 hypothetical protein SGFS_014680 [Streptomyces graminofaciens]
MPTALLEDITFRLEVHCRVAVDVAADKTDDGLDAWLGPPCRARNERGRSARPSASNRAHGPPALDRISDGVHITREPNGTLHAHAHRGSCEGSGT